MQNKPLETTYGRVPKNHPSYKFVKLPANNLTGGSTIVSISGGQSIEVTIPANQPVNLYRSFVDLDYAPSLTAAKANYVPKLTHIFNGIRLTPQSFAKLVDLTDANLLQRVVAPYCTKQEDLEHMDLYQNGNDQKNGQFMRMSNDLVSNIAARRFDNTNSSVNYREVQYLEPGGVGTATPVENIKMPLGILYHTFLEVDRNLIFPTEVVLRFECAPTTRLYWSATGAADPVTGAAAATGTVNINNFQFWLCVETDVKIITDMMALYNTGGIPVQYEFARVEQNLQGPSTNKSLQSRIISSDGKTLKRIYNVVHNPTTSSNTMFDIDNTNATKYTTVRSYLNSQPLQDYDLYPAKGEDYAVMKNMDYFTNSCILNQNVFSYNSVFIDDFCDRALSDRGGIYQNIEQGMPINNLTHQVIYTTANAQHIIYKIIVTSRNILLTSNGILQVV